jgi:hypothetical protein
MSEPTIVTVLRADHQAGLHSEPHRPNRYCGECAAASAQQEPVQVGWVVTDPDGNVVDSGGVSEAHAVAWLGELIDNAQTEGDN